MKLTDAIRVDALMTRAHDWLENAKDKAAESATDESDEHLADNISGLLSSLTRWRDHNRRKHNFS